MQHRRPFDLRPLSLVPLMFWVQPFCYALEPTGMTDLELKSRQVDSVFRDVNTNSSPGCAVSVVHRGRFLHKKGYGMANLDHGIPITPRTKFRIASMSKQITAASIVLLVEQERMSLDDDIRKYVPELPEYKFTVTVRNLLNHSSGLPGYVEITNDWQERPDYFHEYGDDFFRDVDYSMEEFYSISTYLKRIASVDTLQFQPGTKFQYNNLAYHLLGQIVERVSDQTLREFADANIFQPLGMRDTLYNDRAREVLPNRADAYLTLPDGRIIRYNTDLNMVGEGSIFTTIEDYYLWDQNFYRNRLGDGTDNLVATLTTRHTDREYGSGWFGRDGQFGYGLSVGTDNGLRNEQSGGHFVGFRSHWVRYPEKQFSVAVFCNTSQISPSERANKITNIYLSGLPKQ